MRIGDQIELKNGRTGIVEDKDEKYLYIRDGNGVLVKKAIKARDVMLVNETLEKELKDALKAYFMKKYNDEELAEDDMEYVNISIVNDEDGYIRVNLGAEVDYDTLDEMCDVLNPIVQKYDEDAYFDMEDAGLATAFIRGQTNVEDSKVKDESQHLTFGEVSSIFSKHNSENGVKSQFEDENPLYAVAVISADTFNKEFSLEERSYRFRSDNKAFLSDMIGNSIFANSLDGSDTGVRLDRYMNGDSGWIWKIDYCYIENM